MALGGSVMEGAGDGEKDGEAEGAGAATSWVSLTFTVGLEKVKP